MFNPCPVVQWLEVSDFQKSASTWGVWNPHRPKFPSGEARRLKRLAPVLTLVRRQLSGDVAVTLPATFDVLHGYYGCDGTLRDTCGSRCIPALRSTMVHRYGSSIVNSCQAQSSNLLGCLFGYHHYLGRIPPMSSQPSFSMSTPLRWTDSPTRARLFGAAAHAEASDLFPGRDIWVSIGSGIPQSPFNGETNVSRFWGSRKWDNPTWRARNKCMNCQTQNACWLSTWKHSASRPCNARSEVVPAMIQWSKMNFRDKDSRTGCTWTWELAWDRNIPIWQKGPWSAMMITVSHFHYPHISQLYLH